MRRQTQPNVSHLGDGREIAGKSATHLRSHTRETWLPCGYVAELGSAFLCADLGITPEVRDDHAAYIASWLKVLKDDKRFVVSAASHAQRAVDYLHSLRPHADANQQPEERAAA